MSQKETHQQCHIPASMTSHGLFFLLSEMLFLFLPTSSKFIFLLIFFFLFWLSLRHMEIRGPGVESEPELQRMPQL